MVAGIRDLESLDDAIELVLAGVALTPGEHGSEATGLQMLDRLETLTHLGVRVDYPDTDDQRRSPGNATHGLWVDDRVNIVLLYKIHSAGQRESRRLAMRVERLIRLAITGASTLQANHPRYNRSRRRVPQKGWYEITQTFLIHRDAEVL